MEYTNTNSLSQNSAQIHWGHFAIVLGAFVLILGMSYMEKPELFNLNKPAVVADDAPHYYAYVTPAEDLPQPEVLGASTNQGPSLINEDGTVSPVDMGQVLGAATQDVTLPLDDFKVVTVPNTTQTINKYISATQAIENGPIDNAAFETALSSNDQTLINQQADKLITIRDGLKKVSVPVGFEKFHQLTVAQYTAAIGVLQNFTQADTNPELVGQYLNQFLKSQQDLDTEASAVAQKYNIDPTLLGAVGDTAAVDAANSTGSQDLNTNTNAAQ
jgi:hypothetical protein